MESIVYFFSEFGSVIYTLLSVVFAVLLYGYFIYMHRAQRSGKCDYERYADLALKDDLQDEFIEPINTK